MQKLLKLVVYAISCLFLTFIVSVNAQTMVTFRGNGEIIKNKISQKVHDVVYMAIPQTGRINFTVMTEDKTIGFSGTKDLQPELEFYVLALDSIIEAPLSKNPVFKRSPVTGRCEMKVSTDGKLVHSLVCNAKTKASGNIRFRFNGDKTPVDRINLE